MTVMGIKFKGKAKIIPVIATAAIAFGMGILFERWQSSKIMIETIATPPPERAAATEVITPMTAGNEEKEIAASAENEEVTTPATSDNEEDVQTVSEDKSDIEEMYSDGAININMADAEILDQLDGIGEKTAQNIVEYRTENGPFETVDELLEVSGIGEAKLDAIRDKICVK